MGSRLRASIQFVRVRRKECSVVICVLVFIFVVVANVLCCTFLGSSSLSRWCLLSILSLYTVLSVCTWYFSGSALLSRELSDAVSSTLVSSGAVKSTGSFFCSLACDFRLFKQNIT